MCTVSWIHEEAGYQVFCNRDEKRTRRSATEPQLLRRDGVRIMAPIDGDAGGTWIATNEFGITVCLLNGAFEKASPSNVDWRSRGLLVLDLASAESIQNVQSRIWQSDLLRYEPFTLAVLEAGQHTLVIEWDGGEKRILPFGELYMPLASSSFDPVEVQCSRRRQFEKLNTAGTLHPVSLLMFHRSHVPDRGAYSPCMHRADAETASFSWVTVTGTEASFYYSAGPPCRSLAGASYHLALRQEDMASCLACC
jgi:hypothetical protein